MLAVLFVAIRRGQLPALLTAVASVLVLNYFFIAPRHQLTIASSQNVPLRVCSGREARPSTLRR